MTEFHSRSRAFQREVSRAAEWMMKRHVGHGHWWRWHVLTEQNPDDSPRPVLDDHTAQAVFEELKRRELLVESGWKVDASGVPSYLMRYDRHGWDKAVSDGRPIYGAWLGFRRNWLKLLVAFLLGSVLASLENRTVGLIDRSVDALLGDRQESKPARGQIDNPWP